MLPTYFKLFCVMCRSSGSTDSEESTDSEDEESDKRNNTFEPSGTNPDDRMEIDANDGKQ